MMEFGNPAQWASRQKWKRRRSGWAATAKAGVLTCATAGCLAEASTVADQTSRHLLIAGAVGCAGGAALIGVSAAEAFRRAGQAAVGVRSEREVQQRLRRAKPAVAAYGLVLGPHRGDCDVAVVTRSLGVAAVEVKTGFGKVSYRAGAIHAGSRTLLGDPVAQATAQARLLSKCLDGRAVLPIVCIPGMTNKPFRAEGHVYVCSGRDLDSTMARAVAVFASASYAEQTFTRLWELCRD